MYQDTRQLHNEIKKKSWATRNQVLAEKEAGFKFISTYALNDLLSEPKDWNAIALRCSQNPNHKFFGKTVEFIREQWSSKSTKGKDNGIKLDDYISAKLNGHQLNKSNFSEDVRIKTDEFDKTYDQYFSKLVHIGSEMWLTSKLGISVRFDALFLRPKAKAYPSVLIAEWKNTENLSTSDRWNKFIGPASHIEASDLAKYTFQTHIYRYILEEYGIFKDIQSRIFQYPTGSYKIHKEAFDYDPRFIEKVVEWCFEERERRKQNEN